MKALAGIFPLGSLKVTKAGSLWPEASTAKATVKPRLAQPVFAIRTVASPTRLLALDAGLSIRTIVWSILETLYAV